MCLYEYLLVRLRASGEKLNAYLSEGDISYKHAEHHNGSTRPGKNLVPTLMYCTPGGKMATLLTFFQQNYIELQW